MKRAKAGSGDLARRKDGRRDAAPTGGRPALRGGLDRRGAVTVTVRQECPNARVVMQPDCSIDDTEETTDPNDRAHAVRYPAGMGEGLMPAREVGLDDSEPRMYHASLMVGPEDGRVSFESAIEDCEAHRRRLLEEWGEIEGVTCSESLRAIEYASGRRYA